MVHIAACPADLIGTSSCCQFPQVRPNPFIEIDNHEKGTPNLLKLELALLQQATLKHSTQMRLLHALTLPSHLHILP